MKEYDQIFDWYSRSRDHETGVNLVKSAFKCLDPGSTIVDLGSGTGIPLAQTMKDIGMDVIGVDSSKLMLESFKANFPETEVVLSSIQNYIFPEIVIKGVLCWGCLFHLTPIDQINVLKNVFKSVAIGGRFLFTSAKEEDSKTGEMNGISFNYYSLGSIKYNELANNAGWKLIHESEDDGKNYVYLFENIKAL